MTRQYIGARYVPIFFDGAQGTEWLPNTQYEPLTIVTRNGNSYTSKKAVPAAIGAPESNPAYWASTGIYSAQVEEYRQEVQELAETVGGFEDDLASLETSLDVKNTFKNVPMLLMGNSWAAGAGATIGKGFTYYMQEFCECDASFIQVRGGDFVETGNESADYPGYTALGSLNLWAATQTEERLNSIQFVVYGGGLNDAYHSGNTYNAEYTAVDTWIKRVHALMPNARVFIIPCPGLGLMPTTFHERCYFAMIDAALANGAVSNPYFITWFYGRMQYKTSDNNTNHLNDAGYQLLAHYVLSLMRGWNGNVQKNFTSITPVKNPDDDYSGFRLTNEGNSIAALGNIVYTGTETGKLADGDVIGTINSRDMIPMNTCFIPAIAYSSTATNRVSIWLQVRNNGEIVFRPCGDGTPWTTNVQIYVNHVFPIMNI